MKVLGIETSCDETSAAVIDVSETKGITLLSNIVASSMQLHSQTGGIIPEIAAREQIKYILPVIKEALEKAQTSFAFIDSIAVTYGPGLIGSLLVGVETAKTLALAWEKPLFPVNHLLGHIYANWIDQKEPITFPAIALIVSGGHTDLVLLENYHKITWIAGTRDDAAGEAFDKIGRLLNLPYPAGPKIEELAKKGNPKRFHFPRPLLHEATLDFSFSGLKTAALRETQKLSPRHSGLDPESRKIDSRLRGNDNELDEQTICDLARATQDAIIDVLVKKSLKAIEQYRGTSFLLGGGVAANETLKQALQKEVPTPFFVPSKSLCTDNAAMIATAAVFTSQETSWQDVTADPELYFD